VCLDGARVSGGVTVKAGGALSVKASKVTGGIASTGAVFLKLCGTDVSGPAGGAPALTVGGSTGPVTVGDPPNGCPADRVSGDTRLTGNTAGVTVAGDIFARGLTVNDGTGATVVSGNTVYGPLACSGNDPAPVNRSQANSAPSKTGQCAGL